MWLNSKIQELPHEKRVTSKTMDKTEQVSIEETLPESAKPTPIVLINNHGQEKDQFQLYQTSRLEDEYLVWNAVYSALIFTRKRCPDLMATYPVFVSRSMFSSTSSTTHITTKQAISTSYEQSVTSTCSKSYTK
eukprot:g4777.t1